MRLEWGSPEARRFETALDHGVLYVDEFDGVPWNGLVNVVEKLVGGTTTPLYFNGIKTMDLVGHEDFQGTIEAYTFPIEFELCLGHKDVSVGLAATGQKRYLFGICYRTKVGSAASPKMGDQLHLIYGLTQTPDEVGRATQTETINFTNFKWTVDAVPYHIPGFTPTAHYVLDMTELEPDLVTFVEGVLYGDDLSPARLPSIEELRDQIAYWNSTVVFSLVPIGMWSASGSQEWITMTDAYRFAIDDAGLTSATVEYDEDEGTYTITWGSG